MVDNYKVLITTSGTGSRLENLTKYTNKSLVRVGKKPAISYIVESYPNNVPIVVTLGHKGVMVKEFLQIAYPERFFEYVEIDKYEGEGSSLLYSISKCEANLQLPFIFHACDTITSDEISPPTENWIGGNKTGNISSYRSFSIDKAGKVTKLHEKHTSSDIDYFYMGICGIKDYKLFWESVNSIIEIDTNNKSLSDCHALDVFIVNKSLKYKEFNNWLDIGNKESLDESRKMISDQFNILDKDDESIFLFPTTVIKFFSDSKLCENRINRTKYLGNKVPKIINFGKYHYQYEYAKGDLLSDVATPLTIKSLIQWSLCNLWTSKNCQNFKELCYEFYINKTKKRIDSFFKNNALIDRVEIINDVKVPNLYSMLEQCEKYLLQDCNPSGFHGDFILDNILINDSDFILLDWRQDFGGNLECGDLYYDLAKLNHNTVINHEIVSKGLFNVKCIGDKIYCDIHRSHRLVECQDAITDIILKQNLNIKKIKVLTSIIWLNMAPLHEEEFGKFLFYFGKYNLWKSLN